MWEKNQRENCSRTIFLLEKITSRDRPKSAPYPRLKNSKKTSKCQVFSFTVLENRKFFGKKWTEWRAKVSQCRKTERGDPLRFFKIHSVAKHEEIEEKTFIFGKKSHSAEKKLKWGTLWDFPTSSPSQNIKKIEGGTLWGKKIPEKKSRSAEKKLEGGPFGLSGYGMLRGKTGKTFLVQFARPNSAIWCNNILVELLRTILVSSCGLKKKKSHYNSRVSLHEAPTKNQKRPSCRIQL